MSPAATCHMGTSESAFDQSLASWARLPSFTLRQGFQLDGRFIQSAISLVLMRSFFAPWTSCSLATPCNALDPNFLLSPCGRSKKSRTRRSAAVNSILCEDAVFCLLRVEELLQII